MTRKERLKSMARKSRKYWDEKEAKVVEKIYSTAVYARLSVEDNEDEGSITTQVELIREYIDNHIELNYTDVYIDNGYTGTNFERPEFTRLIQDTRKGKINCIVVKDMSRFGRNYIEAGYYIETVFPFLGVRLIAINDNFDSNRKSDMDSLMLPIKNMINMMYAKDISKKVWIALQQKKKNGYSVGNTIPFGYIRNAETRRNEIDSQTSFYVYMMFQWKLMGISVNEIRKRLDMLSVPTPRKRKQGKGKGWSNSTIGLILRNRVYIGDTVSNKTDKALYRGREKTILAKDRWIITENTHEAIIARDDFDRVQDILKEQKTGFHTEHKKEVRAKYDMRGFVFCAECGSAMLYECKTGIGNYICRNKKTAGICKKNYINEKLLLMYVINQVNTAVSELYDKDRLFKNRLNEINRNIFCLIKERRLLKEKKRKLYEGHAAGEYGIEDYKDKKNIYLMKDEQIKNRLADEREQLLLIEQKRKILRICFNEFEAVSENMDLNDEFIKKYIKRIEVGRDKRINVMFGFYDILENITINKEAHVI